MHALRSMRLPQSPSYKGSPRESKNERTQRLQQRHQAALSRGGRPGSPSSANTPRATAAMSPDARSAEGVAFPPAPPDAAEIPLRASSPRRSPRRRRRSRGLSGGTEDRTPYQIAKEKAGARWGELSRREKLEAVAREEAAAEKAAQTVSLEVAPQLVHRTISINPQGLAPSTVPTSVHRRWHSVVWLAAVGHGEKLWTGRRRGAGRRRPQHTALLASSVS